MATRYNPRPQFPASRDMHSPALLNQVMEAVRRLGYQLRCEWLDGAMGGICRINGQAWLFIDPSLPAAEQLEAIAQALCGESEPQAVRLGQSLSKLCEQRRHISEQG